MDNLSDFIRGKLDEFGKGNPAGSSPFFVSQLAASFAKGGEAAPDEPPPKGRGKKTK